MGNTGRIRDTHTHRLLVEGPDDQHAVIHLMKRFGVDWDQPVAWLPYVHPAGGYTGVLKNLEQAPRVYRRLGLVLDADLDIVSRWEQVRGRLSSVIELPRSPDPMGTVMTVPPSAGLQCTRIGVWIMPDNSLPGTLENFLGHLVPNGDPSWDYADVAEQHARKVLSARHAEKDALKARLHTWLAWQEQPGMSYGQALNSRVLVAEHAVGRRFEWWFRQVFELE